MYLGLNDYELLYMIRQSDETAYLWLLEKYKRVIWMIINNSTLKYQPRGVERNDLFQEGLISLHEAIGAFREDIKAPFYSFAALCIERQIKTYLRKFNGLTTRQFYHSLSLDRCISEDENLYLKDVLSTEKYQRASIFEKFNKELKQLLISDCLNDLEKSILILKLRGYTYKEIATMVNCEVKYIDNTIQKIKNRIYVYN